MSTVYHRPAAPSGDDSYVRPLFADRCQAGFLSPATDYAEQELDLNSYCISRPAATFFLRASGESMNQAGVQNGDLQKFSARTFATNRSSYSAITMAV